MGGVAVGGVADFSPSLPGRRAGSFVAGEFARAAAGG
jgi:hypothetical protein